MKNEDKNNKDENYIKLSSEDEEKELTPEEKEKIEQDVQEFLKDS